MTIAPDRTPGADAQDVPAQAQRSPWRGHGRGAAPPRSSSTPDGPASDRPVLADGVELVGEYEGSGYKEPHHLARRPNGALVQLTDLLHLVASHADGQRSLADIAGAVSAEFGKTVSEDNVRALVEDKLRPLGVLAAADGTSPDVQPPDPLLGLKFRCTLLTARATRVVTTLFTPLFAPFLVVAVLAGLAAFDIWLFFVHGLADSLRQTVQKPIIFLFVIACVVVSAALHEIGHAAACRYGGARPGRMGAGIYVAWPAFYTDVTDAYRLDRRGRLRTDLGGVYFNAILVLVAAGAFLGTSYEPLLLVCFVLQMQIVQQLLPLLRLDGYYVLSDLVGVPDLFKRIGPILRSALPGKRTDPLVAELKAHVRVAVTLWVLAIVPLLLVNLAFILFQAPRMVATAWDSAARQWGIVTTESGLALAVGVIQLLVLLIPTLGVAITVVRVGRRAGAGAWRWSAGSTARRTSVVLVALLLLASLALAWWPDARLAPYRRGETGTVQQGVRELSAFRSGTPLLRSPSEAQRPLQPVPEGQSAVTGVDAVVPAETPSPSPSPSGSTTGDAETPTPTPSESVTASPTSTATPSPTSTDTSSPTPTSTSLSATATPTSSQTP